MAIRHASCTARAAPAEPSIVPSKAFFHEAEHCELLARHVLPALARTPGRGSVHVWSAGCATGESTWSLAMLLEEARLPPRVEVSILATDSDPKLLARAREAVYVELQLTGLAAARRRHFVRGVGPRRGLWRVIASLRDRVELAELDLRGPWPQLDAFDVIWAHGAFDDLDRAGAAQLVRRFADVLAPGGTMLLGASALVAEDVPELEHHGRAVFRRRLR
jgi:chemotaxis protein methyltransferase CheR